MIQPNDIPDPWKGQQARRDPRGRCAADPNDSRSDLECRAPPRGAASTVRSTAAGDESSPNVSGRFFVSSIRSKTTDEPAPERPASSQVLSPAFLGKCFTGPLTVINGHAQLIRRRAKQPGSDDAVALERSLDAIELAVRQMVEALIAASGNTDETFTDTNRDTHTELEERS